jgi:hypothetical protein
VADVHADNLGTRAVREVKPATHATACIKDSETLPPHGVGPFEVPSEDRLVRLQQIRKATPLVAEGVQRSERSATGIGAGDGTQVRMPLKERRVLREEAPAHVCRQDSGQAIDDWYD